MAKPDNREDNVEKLKQMKENTAQNIEAAEESLALSEMDERQRQAIKKKNDNRAESIQGFEAEIADEINARENGYRE